jgi:hypothetical protein
MLRALVYPQLVANKDNKEVLQIARLSVEFNELNIAAPALINLYLTHLAGRRVQHLQRKVFRHQYDIHR